MSLHLPRGQLFSRRFYTLIGSLMLGFALAVGFLVANSTSMWSSAKEDNNNSKLATHEVEGLSHKKVMPILATGYHINITGDQYQVNNVAGHYLFTDTTGEHALKEGQIIWRDGKAYRYHNGKLVPVDLKDNTYQPGDIIHKDGKAYLVGKDGKLIELHPGEIRSINGHDMLYNGKRFVPLSSAGLMPGDIVYKDAKAYIVGKDGQLHPYQGKLKAGQIVYKDGKFYRVGKDGKLHLIDNGTLRNTPNGRFVLEDGQFIALHPCQLVKQKNQYYITDKQGKLNVAYSGDECSFNGKHYRFNDGKLLRIADPISPLWSVNLKGDEAAFKSKMLVFHGGDTQSAQKPSTSQSTPFLSDKAAIANALSHQGSANMYAQQNGQSQKQAFLDNAKVKTQGVLNSALKSHHYRYALSVGSIIPATLITGINSDLPGAISAQVSQNVFDSATGNYLLIPQGTRLFGRYDSQITYGQNRVLIAWQRLIFPNGDTFDLQGMPGVDLAGLAGLSDQLNNHYWRIFGSSLMFSIFGAAGQLSQPKASNENGSTNQQIIYGAIGQQMSQTASQLVAKNMNIQPTISIRPGANFNILLTKALIFHGPYQFGGSL